MTFLNKMMDDIMLIDSSTLGLIGCVAAIACIIIRNHLTQPIMAILIFPVMFGISVLTYYVFHLNELFMADKYDQWLLWTMLASTVGTVIGISLCALISTYVDRYTRDPEEENRILFKDA